MRLLAAAALAALPQLVLAQAWHGPAEQGVFGQWRNADAATRSITRVEITEGPRVRVWGKCHPQDCDWGKPERAELKRGMVHVRWNHGFAVRQQTARRLESGLLELVTQTHFTDRSQRRDYTSTEQFTRQ